MANKTPYEIRLDVMKMAQEMIESEARGKEVKFKEQIDALRSIPGNEKEVEKLINEYQPTLYTPDEIIARSSSLYEFITKNK